MIQGYYSLDIVMAKVIVTQNGTGHYQQQVSIGKHQLTADEPESLGGDDAGPGPMDLVLAGLGACTAITLHMYAERKNFDVRKITVTLDHQKRVVNEKKVDQVSRRIAIEGPLSEEERLRMLEIANRCPTLLALQQPLEVDTQLEP